MEEDIANPFEFFMDEYNDEESTADQPNKKKSQFSVARPMRKPLKKAKCMLPNN